MGFRWWVIAVACGLAACGARSSVGIGDTSTGGTAAGGTGAGGSGGVAIGGSGGTDAGGSGGGAPLDCAWMTWQTPPLSVPIASLQPGTSGGTGRAPELVRVGANDYAVVFESLPSDSSPTATLASFVLHDPFGTWPPAASPPKAIIDEQSGFAAMPFDASRFAWVADSTAGNRVLGLATPGGAVEQAASWSSLPAPLHFLSRSTQGEYLRRFRRFGSCAPTGCRPSTQRRKVTAQASAARKPGSAAPPCRSRRATGSWQAREPRTKTAIPRPPHL